MSKLTHINEDGDAVMVDVSDKDVTERVAIARGSVVMAQETLALIQDGQVKKGDVLSVAQLAGIMGAKKTPDLIPLCHPLSLTSVKVTLSLDPARNAVDIEARCKLKGRTGVEMEALTAVSVACLTLFDMCKAVDPEMVIGDIKVLEKQGGKTGHWQREA